MGDLNTTDGNEPDERLIIRPLEEVLPRVVSEMEKTRAGLGIPTKAEIEDSDPRLPVIMCTPMLEPEEVDSRTEGAEVIILVAFASGALPDRLTPVLEKRLKQGIPVIVLSDNPGDDVGIIRPKYKAGQEAYDAGALPLQTVNVKDHRQVKAVIAEALDRGVKGQDLVAYLRERFFYKRKEDIPVPEWETEEGIASMRKLTRNAFKRMGITGKGLDRELHKWEFGKYPDEGES